MLVNDLYADARELQKTSGRTQAEICELAGIDKRNFRNTCLHAGIVAPSFVKLIEAIGYDVELIYTPHNES